MLPVPTRYTLVAGCAEGKSHLNAFDNALLAAGIGNINLLRVSSILPPGAKYEPQLVFPRGSLVPTAYGYIIGDVPGEVIAAAVGVAVATDGFGVIMEFAGRCSLEAAREAVGAMLDEAFAQRGLVPAEKKIEACAHTVARVGCCLAAVPLWY
ncbi:MAG: arginine decarboxylase, pyruvoyl-dependent [Bacillota bacterium]